MKRPGAGPAGWYPGYGPGALTVRYAASDHRGPAAIESLLISESPRPLSGSGEPASPCSVRNERIWQEAKAGQCDGTRLWLKLN
eukprot:70936-Hanusia_phi.AAC.2